MSFFQPLSDRVLVKPIDPEDETDAGIILAPTAASRAPTRGVVVAVGPGRNYDHRSGLCEPMTVKVCMVVTWGKFAGSAVEVDGKEYLVMHESDITGILHRCATMPIIEAIDECIRTLPDIKPPSEGPTLEQKEKKRRVDEGDS